MKTNSQKTNKTWMSAAIGFALLLLFAAPQRAVAQWTTNGNNISNTNTGNVGIGTASPDTNAKLHVYNAPSVGVDIQSANTGGWSRLRLVTGTHTYGWFAGDSTQPDAPNKIGLYDYTAGAFRMMIDSSGNVGIGTATPLSTARLQVKPGTDQNFAVMGPVTMADGITLNSFNDAANANKSMELRASAFDFTLGNVGIGTQYPTEKLEVNGTVKSSGGLTITGAPGEPAYVNGLYLGMNGTTATIDAVDQMVDFRDLVISNKTFRVSSWNGGSLVTGLFQNTSGNVGIGTTTPGYKLDVNGPVNATGLNVNGSAITSSQWITSGSNINYATSGGIVGVGQANPAYKLDVNGTAHVSGNMTVDGNLAAKYQDVAEWVPSSEQLPTGTVVVLDSTKSNQVIASSVGYDTRVAGVISDQPGIALGERGTNKVLVATTGRVRVKVDATHAPIQVGDLLVTSDIPGLAMKSEPVNIGGIQLHRPGTLIGKALEPLEKGSGTILVLLSLQ